MTPGVDESRGTIEPGTPGVRYTGLAVDAVDVADLVESLRAAHGARLSLGDLALGLAEAETRELVRITLGGQPLCTITVEV